MKSTTSPQRIKKILFILPVVLLLAASCGNNNTSNTSNNSGNPQQSASEQTQTESPQDQGNVKTFTVTGKNFSFDTQEIKVNKGDKIKITFKNETGFHDWVLDEFNVKTPRISGGQTADVEFTADKTGTFEYYCSVGNHRAMGMKGNLIVQ